MQSKQTNQAGTENYSTGIVAAIQILCYDSGDRADQL